MAEGGECSISVRGSDACFDYACTPCADEGDNQEAQKYCLECKEYLCATCVKHHQKVSATKKHTLQDKDVKSSNTDSQSTVTADNQMFKCLSHPDRDIEMFCGTHEMVYCSLCIAKDHRQCSGILELDEAAGKIPVVKEDVILRKVDAVQTDIQNSRQKKKINLTSLEQEKDAILETIHDTEKLIIGKVRELASDAKTKTCIRYDDLRKELMEEDSALLQAITDTNELKTEVESQEELDKNRQFVRNILQERIIAQAQVVHDSVGKGEKKMKCFQNDELIQQVSSADCLVQIVGSKRSLNIKEIPVSITLRTEVNIKGNEDTEICSITGICPLPDGTMVLSDRSNKKLRKLNADFSIQEELDLGDNPGGLCMFDKTDVTLKLNNYTVQIFGTNGKLTKKQTIYVEGGHLTGLACISNELWCYSGNGINVYNREGTVMKTFNNRSFEGTIAYPMENCIPIAADDEFIYVSDLENKVACVDREGSVWSVMVSERLQSVRKACISQNGTIFIAGYKSGNVIMFNGKGECLGELVDGLELPDSLYYNSETHQLIVGHRKMDTLTIIKTDECL